MNQKTHAVTSGVIIIPSVDVIMEILDKTVDLLHFAVFPTSQRMEGCQLCKVLEIHKSKTATLKVLFRSS